MSTFNVLSFGETMALLVADGLGALAAVGRFHKRIAGADSNVAWLSRVGDDAFGRFVIDCQRREGVDCSHLADGPAHPTRFQLKGLEEGPAPACDRHSPSATSQRTHWRPN